MFARRLRYQRDIANFMTGASGTKPISTVVQNLLSAFDQLVGVEPAGDRSAGMLTARLRNAGWLGIAGLCLVVISACATFRSYDREMTVTLNLVSSGDIDAAVDLYQRDASEDRDLLYYMETGELLRLAGRYTQSQQAWFEADRQVAAWEEQARLDPQMLLRDAGSLLINDNTRPYTGQDFEKVMLTTRIALNHLALGQWDQARVAIKQTHEREALIAMLHAEQVRRAEEQVSEEGAVRDFRDLNGYPVETIDSPEVNALRNSYQSAFSHYLAGFVYEALDEPSLAAAGYRQAIELHPGAALLEDGLAGLDARQAQRRGQASDTVGSTDLLVIVETGLAPKRKSVRIDLPIVSDDELFFAPVSFPVLRPQVGPVGTREVVIDDQMRTQGVDVTSVDLMSRRALRDEMPWIVVRAVTRAAVKVAVQKAVAKEDDSRAASTAVKIGAIVSERADERCWRSLPADIAVARMRIAPGKREIEVELGSWKRRFSVELGGPFAVLSVRQVGTAAYMSASPPMRAPAGRTQASERSQLEDRHAVTGGVQ
ncbi:MAG: hypothetical protein PVH25_07920 [Burkholderiales bacterium]|jgi:hypothetical protein